MSYSGPEGEGNFRVTLRLASPARYQLQAVDPVGRALWSLDVAHDLGLWLHHRGRTYCRFEGRFDLSGVPLGPFPLLSLPSLLLGRVPAEPPAGAPPQARAPQFQFRDASHRLWSGALDTEGRVLAWTLSEGSSPKVWWLRRDDWAILSDRERGVQVRWREVLRENLDQEPPRLEPPPGYREVPCGEQEVPDPLSPGEGGREGSGEEGRGGEVRDLTPPLSSLYDSSPRVGGRFVPRRPTEAGSESGPSGALRRFRQYIMPGLMPTRA